MGEGVIFKSINPDSIQIRITPEYLASQLPFRRKMEIFDSVMAQAGAMFQKEKAKRGEMGFHISRKRLPRKIKQAIDVIARWEFL